LSVPLAFSTVEFSLTAARRIDKDIAKIEA
jgi:hypothetical protein